MGNPLAALVLARPFANAVRDRGAPAPERSSEPEPGRSAARSISRVFLAEHYQPGLDEERLKALAGRLRAAAAPWRGDKVRVLASASVRRQHAPGDLLGHLHQRYRLDGTWAEIDADRIVPIVWAGSGRRGTDVRTTTPWREGTRRPRRRPAPQRGSREGNTAWTPAHRASSLRPVRSCGLS